MTNILGLQLKLRRDTVFMKTESGIVFRSRKGTFALRGNSVYSAFQQLLPSLDGKTTGDELLSQVRVEGRRTVSDLLQALFQRGVVQSTDVEDSASIDAQTAEVFAPQIEFIQHYADKPAERFARFRETKLLLLGGGTAFSSAGAALVRNGLRNLHVVAPASIPLGVMDRECERLAERKVSSRVSRIDSGAKPNRFDYDILLYCSERPELALIRRLNAQAIAFGFHFLPAYIHEGKLIVGPLANPSKPGCWECAMLRWSDNASGDQASAFWKRIALGQQRDWHSTDVSEVSAHMLGNTAAMEIFKLRVGRPGPETESALLEQDLRTLETGIKTILAHPDCAVCGKALDVRRAAGKPQPEPAPPTIQESLTRISVAIDETYGAFHKFDDEGFDQIPIRLSSVKFLSETGGTDETRSQTALGWSVENSDASRLHALQKAVQYKFAASPPVSLRRTAVTRPRASEKTIDPSGIVGWLGTSRVGAIAESYLEMADVVSSSSVLVPAGAVHPQFDFERWFDGNGAGTGVAPSLEEAQRKAVRSLFEYTMLAGLAHGTLTAKWWNEEEGTSDGPTAYLLRTRRHLGLEAARVAIVSEGTGAFGALIVNDPNRIARAEDIIFAADFSLSGAINAVLTESIARTQLERGGHLWTDVELRTGRYSKAEFVVGVEEEISLLSFPEESSLQQVAGQSAKRGRRILWLEVTPPDIRLTAALRVVKAVLVHEEAL